MNSISFLVPTTWERWPFWPFLAWNLESQIAAYQPGVFEVVVASGNLACADHLRAKLGGLAAVRGIRDEWPTLGEKRNALLAAATHEYVAWVDDDDWHNPRARPKPLPETWSTYKGIRFLGIDSMQVWWPHPKMVHPLPQLVVGRREILQKVEFPHTQYGEDIGWFRALQAASPGVIHTVEMPILAIVHGQNTSPPSMMAMDFADDTAFAMPARWLSAEFPQLYDKLIELRERLSRS